MLKEAFDNTKKDIGEVKFSSTSLNDPHVKKIIDEIVNKYGVDKSELLADIDSKLKEFADVAKKSPTLYNTIEKNLVEKEIFDLIEKHKIADNAPKFSLAIFTALIRRIKSEHDQFFPLRNFIDSKHLYSPVIIIVPSSNPEYQKYNDIDTAAATPTGEFIFSKPFMQKLLDYAHLKGLTPKGKKYEINGGDIPNEYAYIEFLVIHEFMHYTYADFHYQKKMKADPTIINWVGDFRSNYLLVKSGFEQLPIGLFNDHINYDRQNTYKEMYDKVKEEFDKLNKDQQKKVQDAMGSFGDDHSDKEGSGEPTSGEPGKGDSKSGKPSNASGSDKKEDESGDVFDQLDKNNEEIEKKIGNAKEVGKEEGTPKEGPKGPKPSSGSGSGSRTNGRDGEGSKFDYSQIRPTFTWKKLLSKMVTEVSSAVEETYQKPHRRNITGVHLAQQTGSAAMKPGEITLNDEIRLGFIIDSSGSMTSTIGTVYSNLDNLMKGKSTVNKANFYLIKFSSQHHIYHCNFSNNKYTEMPEVFSKSTTNKTGSIKDLFTSHLAGGTSFTNDLVRQASLLAKKKYNLLVISDSDILSGENFENVKNLLAENKGVFIILDSRNTFIQFAQKLKQIHKNVTYFE